MPWHVVSVSFSSLWQTVCENSLKLRDVSELQVSELSAWPGCKVEASHQKGMVEKASHLMAARKQWEETNQRERDGGQEDTPPPPKRDCLSIILLNYNLINRLIHWWSERPFDQTSFWKPSYEHVRHLRVFQISNITHEQGTTRSSVLLKHKCEARNASYVETSLQIWKEWNQQHALVRKLSKWPWWAREGSSRRDGEKDRS